VRGEAQVSSLTPFDMATRPLEIELALPIRSYDIDVGGIVSNIVYVRWLEDLRYKTLETYFPFDEQLKNGFAPVIMHTRIDYKRQLKMFEQPLGRMWVTKLGKIKWYVAAEILVNETLAASAEQYGCFVTLTAQRPIPMPPALLAQYAAATA